MKICWFGRRLKNSHWRFIRPRFYSPKEERFGLTSQVRRASASIAANLAGGCGRRSDGEMARFVQIAMGSGAELSYHFPLARDLSLMQAAEYDVVNADTGEIMRMWSALSGKPRGCPPSLGNWS
jgi:four helix bundle protein